MKRFTKAGIILVVVLGIGIFLEGCASSRGCSCSDINKPYKSRGHKKNIY